MHEIYDIKSLYLETDASGVGLGAALLQAYEGATCQKDKVPENTILHPIAFASKSLAVAKCRYSNIERKGPRYKAWAQKISSLLFHEGSLHNY